MQFRTHPKHSCIRKLHQNVWEYAENRQGSIQASQRQIYAILRADSIFPHPSLVPPIEEAPTSASLHRTF